LPCCAPRSTTCASTITQQVAKNFLLTNEYSYKRKIREAILAFRMERAMSKDKLLELYLNQIYLGQGSYGVAAAALNYFNKSLEELKIQDIAYLAALPKAPNNYNPVLHYKEALARRNWVIDRMAEDGYITTGQAGLAKAAPLQISKGDVTPIDAPYFTEEVRRELSDHYGEKVLYSGGLAVRTSVDPRLQAIAVRTLRDGLMAYDRRHGWRGPVRHFPDLDDWAGELAALEIPAKLPEWQPAVVLNVMSNSAKIGFADKSYGSLTLDRLKWARRTKAGATLGPEVTSAGDVLKAGDVILVELEKDKDKKGKEIAGKTHYVLRQIPKVNGAIVAIDPHTGRVLAMQGGWSFEESEYNRATQAWRQPGSSFKPFVYLAGLDHGFTPATLILDAPFSIDVGPGLPKWRPVNYHGEYFGPATMRLGLEKSRNLMTVRLAQYIGMDSVVDYAKKFGIVDKMETNLSKALGSGETTLMRLTTAYAQLVNGGKKLTPTLIDRIQDKRGKTIFNHDRRPCDGCGPLIEWKGQPTPVIPDIREQIADPRHAYQIVSMLEGVVQRGTGIRIKALGRPLAGKTGTTNESRDAWFVGFSPDLAVGVFTGFDNPATLGRRETGSSVAVPIFKEFMAEALADTPPMPFRVPPGIRQVLINQRTGARAKPGDEHTIWEAFVTGTEPSDRMYILDENGISVYSSGSGSAASAVEPGGGGTSTQDAPTTGTGGLY
jgi:penicillin-binding protein 1A